VRGHVELESIAAARDLLNDPVPLNGLMRVLGSLSFQQRPKGEMRRRKTGQIVLAERQRFSQLQRAGQRSETFTGEMGKRSARRLMKYQRLQPGISQPAQEIFIPRQVALRQNAEAKTRGLPYADPDASAPVPR
jgi:hypothetical protein